MKILVFALLFATASAVAPEDFKLSRFGSRVYQRMTAANIFEKVFSVPTDPDEVVRAYVDANKQFIDSLGIPADDIIQKLGEVAKDNFNGHVVTSYMNFLIEMHLAEYVMKLKGIWSEDTADYYGDLYYQTHQYALDTAGNSGSYYILCWGDTYFYGAMGVGAVDGRKLMEYYLWEMEQVRNS